MLLGSARFAWTSDYAQIYLIGRNNTSFVAPEDVGTQDLETGCRALKDALVIYTADCLRQEFRIELLDKMPAEKDPVSMSGLPWTKQYVAQVTFESPAFTVSSPSGYGVTTKGPWFEITPGAHKLRLSWCELSDDRYSVSRPVADEICVQVWPDPEL